MDEKKILDMIKKSGENVDAPEEIHPEQIKRLLEEQPVDKQMAKTARMKPERCRLQTHRRVQKRQVRQKFLKLQQKIQRKQQQKKQRRPRRQRMLNPVIMFLPVQRVIRRFLMP